MTIKIYKPSKTSMQSGFKKTKLWLAEYISDVEKVKDSLMEKSIVVRKIKNDSLKINFERHGHHIRDCVKHKQPKTPTNSMLY